MKNKLFNVIVAFLFMTATVTVAQEPTVDITGTFEAGMTPEPTFTYEATPEVTEVVIPVEPAPTPPARVDHNDVATLVLNSIFGMVIAAFGSSPVTVLFTSLLKNVKALRDVRPEDISFGVAAVLYVLALGASVIGKSVQFEGVLEFIVSAAPIIVSFIATLTGAKGEYHLAKALDIPVVGEERKSRDIRWS